MSHAPHAQEQSALLSRLPFEIRSAIYLELWRDAGLKLHTLNHEKDGERRRFCTRPCITDFNVMDERQVALQALFDDPDIPWDD